MRGTCLEECSQPSCAGLPLRQLAADHHVEGDIFKNVLLCQLDVKEAILKSVRWSPAALNKNIFFHGGPEKCRLNPSVQFNPSPFTVD